jgi:hypothetical protein
LSTPLCEDNDSLFVSYLRTIWCVYKMIRVMEPMKTMQD